MRIFTSWKTWPDTAPALEGVLPAETLETVRTAAAFAAKWHGPQLRPTGAPYLEHLLEALEVAVLGAGVMDRDVLAAILLHDVVEDTSCGLDEIREHFGETVADLVGWVTKPPSAQGQDKRAVKDAYLRSLTGAPPEAIVVKLADRTSNVQTLQNMPEEFQRRYFRETVEHIIPLAADHPWFAEWFGTWRKQFEHLSD